MVSSVSKHAQLEAAGSIVDSATAGNRRRLLLLGRVVDRKHKNAVSASVGNDRLLIGARPAVAHAIEPDTLAGGRPWHNACSQMNVVDPSGNSRARLAV